AGTTNAVYTLNYQAGSPGQTLTVKWYVNAIFNQWSNVTLQGATLFNGTVPFADQQLGILELPVDRQLSSFLNADADMPALLSNR
ncbi:MAG: hypothetical protein DYH05_14205, partial [Acidobacteria bacterium ACB1]